MSIVLPAYSLRELPGRLLGSVALRYGNSAAVRRWPPASRSKMVCRHWHHTFPPEDHQPGDGPLGRSPSLARLEAVLFLATEPLPSRKLAQLAGLADGTEARTLVRALNRLYDAGRSAFRAVEVAGGFRTMTRPEFAPWLRRLHSWPTEVRLSGPAMETLAVVAYRQPVLRAQIEAVRGVQCGEILRQLMERELVRIAGRSEELGRPFLYGTTKQFLQVFGLRNLDELPHRESFETVGFGRQESSPDDEAPTQPVHDSQTEEESKVKTVALIADLPEDLIAEDAKQTTGSLLDEGYEGDEYDYEEGEDEEDEEDEEEEEEEELEEELDEEDGFEEGNWEEVDEENGDEEDEDEEDEDWDEENEDDWDEEDAEEDWEEEDDEQE